VDPDVVAKVVSDWTGIPLGKVMRDEAMNVINLEANLKKRIKGQDEGIGIISEAIKSAKAGLTDPQQPMGIFLFVGPSGVGKTETGLAVADLLFGGERFLVTVNMSEFQEGHTVSRLIGSPPGYVGYGEGGVLTEAVRQRPYSVVLIDETEKAHLDVMNIFYQVFDKGVLSDGEGRVIDFKNTVQPFQTGSSGPHDGRSLLHPRSLFYEGNCYAQTRQARNPACREQQDEVELFIRCGGTDRVAVYRGRNRSEEH
jgi:type VI secretion system protein VasG